MKTMNEHTKRLSACRLTAPYSLSLLILFALTLNSCDKKTEQNALDPTSAANQNNLKSLSVTSPVLGNVATNILVANIQGLGAQKTDPVLVNAWGLAIGDDNSFLVSCNGSGLAEIYGADGHREDNPIDIPFHGVHFGSKPAGVVRNTTSGFVIPSTGATSQYLFATENGTIAAWSQGKAQGEDTAVTVIDRSATGAIYKGIAIAQNGGANYIYATNFYTGKVDVFDQSFNYVRDISLADPTIPKDFMAFNIKNIDGRLFVTYAIRNMGTNSVVAGEGSGYINIFNPDGSLFLHLAKEGRLNAPWGMAATETNGRPEHLLVGNFGDGHISVFDMQGNYDGQLGTGTKALTVSGLWDLAFKDGDEKEFENGGQGVLYFTAGPAGGTQGLFGYFSKANPSPATSPVATVTNQNLIPSSYLTVGVK
jgi:uncharacterized protein (TIGR03118 family)